MLGICDRGKFRARVGPPSEPHGRELFLGSSSAPSYAAGRRRSVRALGRATLTPSHRQRLLSSFGPFNAQIAQNGPILAVRKGWKC
jgi:hypothetical protein